jgi:hypothetical protein
MPSSRRAYASIVTRAVTDRMRSMQGTVLLVRSRLASLQVNGNMTAWDSEFGNRGSTRGPFFACLHDLSNLDLVCLVCFWILVQS